jgi:hypothetical protein
MRRALSSYKITSDLSEKQIEADVAKYLGWCAEGLPLNLLDVNEQVTGADKRLDWAVPIYLQFKKSTGLRPLGSENAKPRLNASPLQGVRAFRRAQELSDTPTLFFQLRAQSETARDLQHNILLLHNRPPFMHAVYVAPLELDYRLYSEMLFSFPRYQNDPVFWRHSHIYQRHWVSWFDTQPFLRNHVSIAPHERVADHNHYFAYSKRGDDISWHSPSILDRYPRRLSDFMSERLNAIFGEKAELPPPESSVKDVREILDSLGEPADNILSGESAIDRLQSYGKWLLEKHEIRQFVFLGDRELTGEIRRRREFDPRPR